MVTAGLLVCLACLLVTGGHLYSPDEEILFRQTESLATRGSLGVQPLPEGFGTRTGRDGVQYGQYPPLQSILAIPLYAVARLTRPLISDDTIRRAAWETTQYHDQSPDAYWNRFWVALLFNAIVTALTTMLVWALARRLAGGDCRAAWMTALLYGLATLALAHSRTFFTEPLAALLLLAALAALLIWGDQRERMVPPEGSGDPTVPWRWPLLAGLAAGAGLWTRVDFPLFLPGLSLGVVLLALPVGWRTGRPSFRDLLARLSWKALFAFGVPVGLALIGWFLFNRWRFGGVAATGYEDQPEGVQFATPVLVGLHGFLFSPGKGLFFFSPPLILAVFGLRRLLAARPQWFLLWVITGGVFLVFMCKWQNWAGGWCWGPRHIFQIHPLLILAVAPLLAPPRPTAVKVAAGVLLVVGLAIQIFGCSQSFIDFYREYYAFSAREQPNFYALYSPQEDQAITEAYTLEARTSQGPVPIPAHYLPAPINDSIYVPRNTQWYAYPEMLSLGQHDWFWIHLLQ